MTEKAELRRPVGSSASKDPVAVTAACVGCLAVFVSLGLAVALLGALVYVAARFHSAPWFAASEAAIALALLSFVGGHVRTRAGNVRRRQLAGDEQPEIEYAARIDLSRHPRLHAVLADLASSMQSEIPGIVAVAARPNDAVLYDAPVRGTIPVKALLLSLPVLCFLTVDQFRCRIAHEFAHIGAKDSLNSSTRGLTNSMWRTLGMMRPRFLYWWNPCLWLEGAIVFLARVLAFVATRRRKAAAERASALLVGSNIYRTTGIAAMRYSGIFLTFRAELAKLPRSELPKDLIREYVGYAEGFGEDQLAEGDRATLVARTRLFDVHPCWRTLLAKNSHLPEKPATDTRLACELFDDLEDLEIQVSEALARELDDERKRA